VVYSNQPLDGISGGEQLIVDLISQAQDQAKGENASRLDTLLSRVVLEAAPNTTRASLEMIYGDTYHLQREVIEDAHATAALIRGKTVMAISGQRSACGPHFISSRHGRLPVSTV
jgi:hypothetical protein